MSRSDLFRSEPYNEVLRPYNFRTHGSAVLWLRGGGWAVSLVAQSETRTNGLCFTPSAGGAAAPCADGPAAPRESNGLQRIRSLFRAALDAMSIAALLVTGKGRVRYMNQLRSDLSSERRWLAIAKNVLSATDSRENEELALLIAGAVSNGKNGSEPVRGGGAIRLSRAGTPGILQVTVLPVPEQKRIAASGSFALVLVSDPSSLPRPRAALMQQMYGLTPAESRLADLPFGGSGSSRGCGAAPHYIGTARFHLKRVLAKTGTHRQTELMRLMLSLPVRTAR